MVAVSTTSCNNGGEDEIVDEIVVDEDYYEFQLFNLTKDEIPATIYLPDETANI